jgi:hypothetical protein
MHHGIKAKTSRFMVGDLHHLHGGCPDCLRRSLYLATGAFTQPA